MYCIKESGTPELREAEFAKSHTFKLRCLFHGSRYDPESFAQIFPHTERLEVWARNFAWFFPMLRDFCLAPGMSLRLLLRFFHIARSLKRGQGSLGFLPAKRLRLAPDSSLKLLFAFFYNVQEYN
jgi:hypothetical protein